MSKRNQQYIATLCFLLCSPAIARAQVMPNGTVLVANMDDDSVWLVDVPTGEHRGTVRTHIAPHEIAVSGDGNTAAITNYGDQRGPGNLIQFLHIATAEVTHEVEVEGYERIHGAAFLPGDSLLAVTSERTGEILILDVRSGEIRRKLATNGRASHMLSLGGPWIYAANIVDGTVSRIDPNGNQETTTWPAGTRTEGVVATPDGSQGWTGSMEGGEVVGVNGATGEVVARIEGLQVPYRLGVTPDGATILVSDPGSGVLALIDRHGGTLRQRVDLNQAASVRGLGNEPSPQGFVLSSDGRWAFVATKAIDRFAVVNLQTATVTDFFQSGDGPDGIAFSPVRVDGTR